MRYFSILVFSVFLIHSCNFTQSGQEDQRRLEAEQSAIMSCAEPRLLASFDFHKSAKNFLSSYYKTRKESELFFSWYSMEDSVHMAKSVRACWDKRNKHFLAAKNVFQKNRVLERLIVQNMRQYSQSQLSELYLEDYHNLFVRDIQ